MSFYSFFAPDVRNTFTSILLGWQQNSHSGTNKTKSTCNDWTWVRKCRSPAARQLFTISTKRMPAAEQSVFWLCATVHFIPPRLCITIRVTEHSSSPSSLSLSFLNPILKQPHTSYLILFPQFTTFRICTLLSCQAFSKNSGVFRLSCLSATLPEQFVIPPTSSWIQSASPQLLRNNALRTVCLCVHIHCGLSVSSTVDHMNIYHAVTSPPSYSALIITAELDHLSHRR